jgi:hypothetical protein
MLASFESAYLAAKSENSEATLPGGNLIFTPEVTKWFSYSFDNATDVKGMGAAARAKLGDIDKDETVFTFYDDNLFLHCFDGTKYGKMAKYIPSFLPPTRNGSCPAKFDGNDPCGEKTDPTEKASCYAALFDD